MTRLIAMEAEYSDGVLDVKADHHMELAPGEDLHRLIAQFVGYTAGVFLNAIVSHPKFTERQAKLSVQIGYEDHYGPKIVEMEADVCPDPVRPCTRLRCVLLDMARLAMLEAARGPLDDALGEASA